MARKKPSWLQKAQTATSNVVKPVVQAVTPPPAPKVMQNIQKAADKVGNVIKPAAQAVAKEAGYVVNPIAGEVAFRAKELAKNPDVVKAGNAIANKVINPITTSAPVKAIQQSAQQAADTTKQAVAQAPAKAIQAIQNATNNTTAPAAKEDTNLFEKLGDTVKQGAQWLGNTFNSVVAPDTSRRTPTVKIAGNNPLEKDRTAKNPMKDFGPAGNPNRDFEQLQPMTSTPILDDENVNPLVKGIKRVKDALNTSEQAPEEGRGLPEEGVLVAGNGVIPTKTAKDKNAIIQSIGDRLSQGVDYLGGGITTGMDKAGQVIDAGIEWFKQGTDSMVTKGFTTQYGDVITQRDMDRFREAEKRGDIAEMDRIRAEMKIKQQQQGAR